MYMRSASRAKASDVTSSVFGVTRARRFDDIYWVLSPGTLAGRKGDMGAPQFTGGVRGV